MIPSSFTYKRAGSVAEALTLLGEDGQLLAGGHSLIPAMKLRLNQPEVLVDISRIAALQNIEVTGGKLVIGAGVTHGSIAASSVVHDNCAILAEGAEMIGDVQVRNKGTLGGSLAHADPAADWPALLLATDAEIVVMGAKGEKTHAAADFFTGFYTTALEPGEIITAVHFPVLNANTKATYHKFMQPASRFAIVGAAVVVEVAGGNVTKANVSLTGVSDAAFQDQAVIDALVGKPFTEETVSAAAQLAAEDVDISSDHYASEAYRKHLAKVYTARALKSLLD